MNNKNKTELIKLTFQYIMQNKEEILQILKTQMMILSGDNECFEVTSSSSTSRNLKSNQEEADTKVILHALQVLQQTNLLVMLRSPSGDTDIFVLALGLICEYHSETLYYDYRNGNNQKGTWLSALLIEENHRSTLIGFHAFTGNDYMSSFFRKDKKVCWNTLVKEDIFIECFLALVGRYHI